MGLRRSEMTTDRERWRPGRLPPGPTLRSAGILAVVWLVGAAWGWSWLDRGWVPHDEGALGQSAERVLVGELPHVDFDEIYTGALTYVHAVAFEAFGVGIMPLRYVLFAAFVLWLPVFWYVARRYLPPGGAGLALLLAAATSVPNYPSSLPSWYMLFLATLALAGMLRFLDTGALGWLVVAGIAVGASVLMKIVGVYLLIALCLWVAYLEQESAGGESAAAGRTYSVALTVLALLLVAGLVLLVGGAGGAAPIVQFVLPGAALASLLVAREWRVPRDALAARLGRLAPPCAALALGVAIPLIAYLSLYTDGNKLRALYEGVFVAPRTRLEFATMALPRLATAKWTALPVLVLAVAATGALRRRRTLALLAALLGIVFALSGGATVYRATWSVMRWSIPLLALLGAVILYVEERRGRATPKASAAAFGILSVAAFMGLLQFPFSAPVYFLYVAPLALLALIALTGRGEGTRPILVLGMGFLLAFFVVRVTPGSIRYMGFRVGEDPFTERLELPRAGILVSARERYVYQRVVQILDAHPGALWVGPDAPEVYFLSGRRNPTRRIFDFLGEDGSSGADLLATLERARVRIVVVNRGPGFSRPLSSEVGQALARIYPSGEAVGRFEVRWKP